MDGYRTMGEGLHRWAEAKQARWQARTTPGTQNHSEGLYLHMLERTEQLAIAMGIGLMVMVVLAVMLCMTVVLAWARMAAGRRRSRKRAEPRLGDMRMAR